MKTRPAKNTANNNPNTANTIHANPMKPTLETFLAETVAATELAAEAIVLVSGASPHAQLQAPSPFNSVEEWVAFDTALERWLARREKAPAKIA